MKLKTVKVYEKKVNILSSPACTDSLRWGIEVYHTDDRTEADEKGEDLEQPARVASRLHELMWQELEEDDIHERSACEPLEDPVDEVHRVIVDREIGDEDAESDANGRRQWEEDVRADAGRDAEPRLRHVQAETERDDALVESERGKYLHHVVNTRLKPDREALKDGVQREGEKEDEQTHHRVRTRVEVRLLEFGRLFSYIGRDVVGIYYAVVIARQPPDNWRWLDAGIAHVCACRASVTICQWVSAEEPPSSRIRIEEAPMMMMSVVLVAFPRQNELLDGEKKEQADDEEELCERKLGFDRPHSQHIFDRLLDLRQKVEEAGAQEDASGKAAKEADGATEHPPPSAVELPLCQKHNDQRYHAETECWD